MASDRESLRGRLSGRKGRSAKKKGSDPKPETGSAPSLRQRLGKPAKKK